MNDIGIKTDVFRKTAVQRREIAMVAGVFVARWTVPTLLKGTRYVFLDLRAKPHLIVWAIVAGGLWAVANTLTVFAIRDVGLSIAFPLWNTNGLIGLSAIGMRALSPLRTLTLLDSQRVVSANLNGVVDVSMIPQMLIQRVDGLERGPMRDLVDQMRSKLGSGVVVLGAASDGKVALIVGVTKDLAGKVHAGKVVGQLAALVGGKGGGRPDLAEAGGSDAGALDGALAKAADVVGAAIG